MSSIITGVVTNGVVVPNAPLPEGANVEIQVKGNQGKFEPGAVTCLTAGDLRKMPRAERQAVLAAAAALAEEDYRTDKELTAFEAFSEEELDGDESDSR